MIDKDPHHSENSEPVGRQPLAVPGFHGRNRSVLGWRHVQAPDPDLPLEERLFQWITLLDGVLALVVIVPSNYLLGVPLLVNLPVALFGVVAVWLWRESRHGRRRAAALFAAMMATLNAAWFGNGGSQGTVVLYFFHAVLLPVLFCEGWKRLALLGTFFVNALLLYWAEHRFPHMVVPYATPFDRLLDNMVGFVVCTVVLVAVVRVILANYVKERQHLVETNERLRQSLDEVRTLRGMLPICGWCKKVRDDAGLWTQIEQYVSQHTEASFSHGLCPECQEKHFGDYLVRRSDR